MECSKCKELLPFVDDGSLEPTVAAEVTEHLAQCSDCRREHIEIRTMIDVVKKGFASSESQPSLDFLDGVRQKIAHKKQERKIYRWAFSAAAVVILALNITLFSLKLHETPVTGSQEIALAESGSEYYDYIAEQYLDAYELYELASAAGSIDDYYAEDMLLYYDSFHLSLDDIDNMFETLEEF